MNTSARVRCPLSHGARRGATSLSLSTANVEKLDGVEVETRFEERRRIFDLDSSAELARESAENDSVDLASDHDPERVGASPGPGSKKKFSSTADERNLPANSCPQEVMWTLSHHRIPESPNSLLDRCA